MMISRTSYAGRTIKIEQRDGGLFGAFWGQAPVGREFPTPAAAMSAAVTYADNRPQQAPLIVRTNNPLGLQNCREYVYTQATVTYSAWMSWTVGNEFFPAYLVTVVLPFATELCSRHYHELAFKEYVETRDEPALWAAIGRAIAVALAHRQARM